MQTKNTHIYTQKYTLTLLASTSEQSWAAPRVHTASIP